jgi:hypothetical protein
MIRAIRSASPLAAFAILTSAIVAYAECSWVLWNDEVRLDYGAYAESRVWHTVAGTASKPECDARLHKEIERVTHPMSLLSYGNLRCHCVYPTPPSLLGGPVSMCLAKAG